MAEVCVMADLVLLESHVQKHIDSGSVDVTVFV